MVKGRDGDDTLIGDGGANGMFGGEGDDEIDASTEAVRLVSGAGEDALSGEDGVDRLQGDAGRDVLTGGAGDDVFVFNRGDGLDRVTDYVDGQDRIDLSNWGFANLAAVQAAATLKQTTDGIEFDFGNGDILTVIGATLPTLGFSDLVF